jgi:hypothetical protein
LEREEGIEIGFKLAKDVKPVEVDALFASGNRRRKLSTEADLWAAMTFYIYLWQ